MITLSITPEELRLLKELVITVRRRALNLRDGFQPDTKSYKDFQARAVLADDLTVKLLRAEQ